VKALRWLPYATLAGSVLLVLAVGDRLPAAPLPVILAVATVAAGWLWWWRDRRTGKVFFAGLLVLIAALVACSPLFGFFAWTGYLYTAQALSGRWLPAGTAAVAVLTAIAQVGGFWALTWPGMLPIFGIVLLFNVGIATGMTFLSIDADRKSERRRRMIGELADANAKLAAAMRENAGLHAQLLAQAREAGVLDERQRLAGEIHDVLAQGLTGIVTQLEAADQAEARPADRRRHLDQAKRLARDSLSEARRSVRALSPEPLSAAALPEALTEVVDGWAGRHGIAAELVTTGTPRRLLPEIEATLLRTAQEALANVARHAAATRVGLTLSYMEDVVTLDVRDDGRGFDASAPHAVHDGGGFGLAAMRERVQRVAGTLAVESERGGGTAVSACVPAAAA
jgi:signal transduction histidine kinase